MQGAVAHFQFHAVDYQKKMLKYSKTNPFFGSPTACGGIMAIVEDGFQPAPLVGTKAGKAERALQ